MKRSALAFAAGLLALAPSQSSFASVTATISIAQQRMEVSIDGKVTHTWPVSTGKSGHDTPTGSYTPQWLSKDHKSSKYDDAPMPYAVFFKGDYAVHGTMSLGMLGRRASHGCVRLSPANARRFFELVQQHGLSSSKVVIQDPLPKSSEKMHVAEIGSKRHRSERGERARAGHNSAARAVARTHAYPIYAAPAYRAHPMPAYVYQIGPYGQMIPVAYPVYRGR